MNCYIRIMTDYYRHRKTVQLKGLIGEAAWWVMPRLWCYAAESQPDGDFAKYTPQDVATVIQYQADAQALLQALHSTGYMIDMKLHEWKEHNGFHDMYRERAKKAAAARYGKEKTIKEKKGKERKEGCNASSTASSIPIQKAKPEDVNAVKEQFLTLGWDENRASFEAQSFWDTHQSKGWLIGKSPMKDWKAATRTWKQKNYGQDSWNRQQSLPASSRVDQNTTDMCRIGGMLGRKPSDLWSVEEANALTALGSISELDMEMMDAFYSATFRRDEDHRRTSVMKLLQHWNEELDKARTWKWKNGGRS